MNELKIENMSVSDLLPYSKNPRDNKKAISKVASSIEEFGFKNPILITENNEIIAGHTRLLAAKQLGMVQVPIIRITDLTPEKVKAFRIADNKTAEYSEWDLDLLAQELEELKLEDYNLELTGFDMAEVEKIISEAMEEIEGKEEEFPELVKDPVIQEGDLITIGKHKVICGDSTSQEVISHVTAGKKVKLFVTDPPYGVSYVGKTEDAMTIQNDDLKEEDLKVFLVKAFKCVYDQCADGASAYVFHADSKGIIFRTAFIEAGFKHSQCCIWVKNSFVIGRQPYQWQHEPALFGWKPTGPHYWNGDRSQSTVWNFDKPIKNDIHPTMKPTQLIEYIIKNSSKYGDIVFDSFLGSGTTLIAADKTDRICYGCEIDPRYCQAIIERWIGYKDGINGDDIIIERDNKKYTYNELINNNSN